MNNIINKTQLKTFWIKWLNSSIGVKLGTVFSIIVLLFLIHVGRAPLVKYSELNATVKADTLFTQQYDERYDYLPVDSLMRIKALKQCLLGLAYTDSIYLVLNFEDSTLNLALHGVVLHSVKIKSFKIDNLLTKLPPRTYYKLFAEPLAIIQQKSTIIKEPIVEKQAPKNAAEAAENIYNPKAPIKDPAFLQLQLQNNFCLIVTQDSIVSASEKASAAKFKMDRVSQNITNSISSFFSFHNQPYMPSINITIPSDDVRTIYRALPHDASVAICFPPLL